LLAFAEPREVTFNRGPAASDVVAREALFDQLDQLRVARPLENIEQAGHVIVVRAELEFLALFHDREAVRHRVEIKRFDGFHVERLGQSELLDDLSQRLLAAANQRQPLQPVAPGGREAVGEQGEGDRQVRREERGVRDPPVDERDVVLRMRGGFDQRHPVTLPR